MPLTEIEKQRIAEEEEYRAKVKEEKKKKGCGGCLIAILIIIAVPMFALIAINPAKQLETAEKNAQIASALEIKSGSFMYPAGTVYTYEITSEVGEDGNKKYVASYTPFLQNNDITLLMAILEAFKTTYGNDGQIVPTPILEERNGTNIIKFTGDIQDYYVFPIKEDTGEIHTLMFWKE